MDLLVELASTGRIGAVRVGMTLDEAHALLGAGRPHPMLKMRPETDGYPYSWGSLLLEKTGDRVTEVMVGLRPGTRLVLPAALGSAHDGAWATVEREAFLGMLAAAGCPYQEVLEWASAEQTYVRTEVGTTARFQHFRQSEHVPVAGFYLMAIRYSA